LFTKAYKSFLVLPFVNRKVEDFAVRLKALVEDNYTQLDFNVAFKSQNTIGNMFPFKDRIREIDNWSCTKSTVLHVTPNTLEKLSDYSFIEWTNTSRAINQHAISTQNKMHYGNIIVIDRASNGFKLRMKELLHILHLIEM